MHDSPLQGLSRRELERELGWLLRRAPQDPAKLVEFLGDIIVTLIDKNNVALAQSAASQKP